MKRTIWWTIHEVHVLWPFEIKPIYTENTVFYSKKDAKAYIKKHSLEGNFTFIKVYNYEKE